MTRRNDIQLNLAVQAIQAGDYARKAYFQTFREWPEVTLSLDD